MTNSKDITKLATATAKAIKDDVSKLALQPIEGTNAAEYPVIHIILFKKYKRDYIERIVNQINRTYMDTCYDACAVMMRRLLETLIIELYEAKHLEQNIKDPTTGEFKMLEALIATIKSETIAFSVDRNSKKAMDIIKALGDRSAHNRRFNANRDDIDKASDHLRVVVGELLTLAGVT